MVVKNWRRCCRTIRIGVVRNKEIRSEMGIDIGIIKTIEIKRLN